MNFPSVSAKPFPDENRWVLKPHNGVLCHDKASAWLKRWTTGP